MRKPELTFDNLVKLGTDKLARIVIDEASRNAGFKRQVSAALAGQVGPAAVAKIVDRRLAGLERAKSFIDWHRARPFRNDLQNLLDLIEVELVDPAPALAVDRLLRFIASHERVFKRVDDSRGDVQDVYYRAIEMIGKATSSLDADDADLLPGKIMLALGETTHGYLSDVAESTAKHLPKPVLVSWDTDLIARIATRSAEERGCKSDRWHYSMTSEWREVRQALAEARGDLDLRIALENEKSPRLQQPLALAATLLAAGRAEQALAWVRRDTGVNSSHQIALEAQILSHLERESEAAALLWHGFEATLSTELLRAHIKMLPDFENADAEDRAIQVARDHPNSMAALAFLMAWPRPDEAATLIIAHEDRWDGGDWYALPDFADTLRHDHPVAATILYRKLLDSILARARSKAYGHAARYLATLGAIAKAAEADPDRPGSLAPHEDYVAQIRSKHARKSSFWAKVETTQGQ